MTRFVGRRKLLGSCPVPTLCLARKLLQFSGCQPGRMDEMTKQQIVAIARVEAAGSVNQVLLGQIELLFGWGAGSETRRGSGSRSSVGSSLN